MVKAVRIECLAFCLHKHEPGTFLFIGIYFCHNRRKGRCMTHNLSRSAVAEAVRELFGGSSFDEVEALFYTDLSRRYLLYKFAEEVWLALLSRIRLRIAEGKYE